MADREKRLVFCEEAEDAMIEPPVRSRPRWSRCRLLAALLVPLGLLLLVLPLSSPACRRHGAWPAAGREPLGEELLGSATHGAESSFGGPAWDDELSLSDLSRKTPLRREDPIASASASAAAAAAAAKPTVVECFQVAQPVLTPKGATTSAGHVGQDTSPPLSGEPCTVVLMDHVFAYSYGMPFVGNYTPPACQFNRVVMNFTVVSQGRQFDRLALMYLNDTEVWRTSTAEPTAPPGIRWVYMKDMTEYLSLWRQPQTVIFDLGNLVNDVYTGSFNATLTATFFQAADDLGADGAPPSDVIIPVSARRGAQGAASQFTLPQDNATNTISGFPRNANRAVFSVSANGQADEEFWWSNVLQSDVLAFNATAGRLTGFSPFREVQLLIDGRLAGVQWPFPVIFTGGVVPGLHRPVVGIDVFDLREHEIDITPWLPLLCDGAAHTFTIQVAGLNDDGGTAATLTQTVAASWYVTGKIFVWLDDDPAAVTTGSPPTVSGAQPTIAVSQSVTANATGANETLRYTAEVRRSLSVTGRVVSQRSADDVSWTQTLSYSNGGLVAAFGFDQVNNFSLQGADAAAGGARYRFASEYAFPLFCNTTTHISPQGNLTLWARLRQGLSLQVSGAAVFPTGLEAFASAPRGGSSGASASLLRTTVEGTASFSQTGDGKNSSGFGTTTQVFRFGGLSAAGALGDSPDVELYFRNVTAANNTVVRNREVVGGVGTADYVAAAPAPVAPFDADGEQQQQGQQTPLLYVFAQAPTDGGTGPRVFTGRGGPDPAVASDGTGGGGQAPMGGT